MKKTVPIPQLAAPSAITRFETFKIGCKIALYVLLIVHMIFGQTIGKHLAKVAWLHFPIHWLDVWLCVGALLVLCFFEYAQAKAGRTTPLAAFVIRLFLAK